MGKGGIKHQTEEKIEAKKKKSSGGGFQSYNLSPDLYKAIVQKGYKLPTPIQRRAIPTILQGFNVIAMARTGSGKTASFVIPIIEKLQKHSETVGARCVILSPTREIALQTASYFKALSKNTDLTHVLIVGGNEMGNQFERLMLNPDVIIGTPGRLMHCIQQTGLSLARSEIVVYDEADRLFEMGFAEQIKAITDRMPKNRQSCLFSATISSQVKDFTLSGMKDYKMVQVDKDSKLSDELKMHFFVVRSGEKEAAMIYIMEEMIMQLKDKKKHQTIIFGATRYHVEYLYEVAKTAGLNSTFIYGAMDQKAREEKLQMFRSKKVQFLFVTDLAARGIDIPLLENVIHFDFPTKMKLFIHRAGRTARAGQSGTSYSIITPEELAYLHDLSIFVGRKYFDKPEEENNEDSRADLLSNPSKICFGKLPQSLIDEYQEYLGRVKEKNETTLEGLQKSVNNALIKYNKTKDPASTSSVAVTRALKPAIHPLLANTVDKIEVDLMNFKEQLAGYKPKQSVLEIGITKTNDFERIDKFKQTLVIQDEKHKQKLDRQKTEAEMRLYMDQLQRQEDKRIIDMEAEKMRNDAKLRAQEEKGSDEMIKRMSKKRRMKLEKIMRDQNLSEEQKQMMKSECMEDRQELKRQKRSDFKDDRNFITEKRMETAHSSKANDSSLWTSNEKDFLEDVTLNLIPDDEALNVKGKTVMKWDKLKKRYMLKKVDRDGQVMTEKRNEAGAKITKKNAEKTGNNIYKKWQKETHLSLQRVGEKENKSLVKQARNANESRKMVKQFSSRHKDFNKGDDIRNPQGLIDQKKKRLMNKMNENHARNKRDGKGGRGQQSSQNSNYQFAKGKRGMSNKSRDKIIKGSRPTRSKVISKGKRR